MKQIMSIRKIKSLMTGIVVLAVAAAVLAWPVIARSEAVTIEQEKERSKAVAEDCDSPPLTEENCTDGLDNDCDDFIDSKDSDCVDECLPKREACTEDAECCSNWCHRGACK
jgi:hypothetical protein